MRSYFRSWKSWILLLLATLIAVGLILFSYFPNLILAKLTDREFHKIGFEAKNIQVDGTKVHYVEGGRGDKVLLLVHGFRSSIAYWLAYVPYFQEHYHIIALDLPGHGSTGRPAKQHYDMKSMAKFLHQFVEVKGLKEFDMMGASMGGGVALAYAIEHPEHPKAISVINPLAVHPPAISEVHAAYARGEYLLLPHDARSFERMQEMVYGSKLDLNPILGKLVLNSLVSDRDFFTQAFNEMVQAGGLEDVLPKLKTPLLVIQSNDDRVVDASSVTLIEKLVPSMNLYWIPNGAHALRGEDREKAAFATLDFLKNPKISESGLKQVVEEQVLFTEEVPVTSNIPADLSQYGDDKDKEDAETIIEDDRVNT